MKQHNAAFSGNTATRPALWPRRSIDRDLGEGGEHARKCMRNIYPVAVRDRRTWLPLKCPFLRRVLNTCIGKWPFSRCRVRAPCRGRERSVSSVSGCHRAPTQSSVNMCSGPSPAGTVLETWAHRGLRGERRGCGGKRGIPLLVACFCYNYVE